jgi:hypothetical protein
MCAEGGVNFSCGADSDEPAVSTSEKKSTGGETQVVPTAYSHSQPRNNPLKAIEYATEIANLAFLRGVYPLESVGYGREPVVFWKGLVEHELSRSFE